MRQDKAFDPEPPIASLLKSMLIGGGPVNADVITLAGSREKYHELSIHNPHASSPHRDCCRFCVARLVGSAN